jgi:transposase
MHRYALRDDQWGEDQGFLSRPEGPRRRYGCDNRLFVDAVIYRYRTGIPWRDLPERYGQWKSTHRRYRRWCKSGVFARIFETLAADADNEFMMIDATIVRAHQHSAGAQKKTARIKPSAVPAAA